jgi:predicted sulfurtransferase
MSDPNAIMIDVRNYNESIIGKFAPPGIPVLDPLMRRSTEFPKWVDDNLPKLQGKKVLMYCTGGIRCERASAYLLERGLTDVNQLEGGIHRCVCSLICFVWLLASVVCMYGWLVGSFVRSFVG